MIRGADAFLIPFGLLWCGFAVFWEISVARSDAPAFFLAFGALFVVIGLYVVAGRFWYDALMRKNTLYGITNERVIIRSGVFRAKLESLNLRTLSNISLIEKHRGEGTITFGPSSPWDSWFQGVAWPGMPSSGPRFESVSDARQVYEILRKAHGSS